MNKELEGALSKYLGELLFQNDNNNDWIEREKIIAKINAVYVLLEINDRQKTFMETVQEKISESFKNMPNRMLSRTSERGK